jgi:multiple sugar transport system substrate-binding protein
MAKKLSRREFMKMAAIGASGAVLASCGVQETPTPAPVSDQPAAQPAAPEKQVVTFTMYGHPGMVEEMVPLFNAAHPEVEVRFERSEGQGYWEKLAASIAGGAAWDSFRGDQVRALNWGPKNVIADLTSLVESDTTYKRDDYLPGVLDVYNVGGKIYGVPTWCLTMWLFYNKNLFDEAGVSYPTNNTTWDEYVEMAKALTKTEPDGRITQYGTNGWEWWTFPVAQVVWSNGGGFYYNQDLTGIDVNNPKTAQALQDITDLIHVHKTNPSPLNPPTSPVGLLSDNVATEANGDYFPWDNNELFTEKYDYLDAVQCPTRNGQRVNIYWPDAFHVNAKSNVKEGAYKWCAWFGSDPQAIEIQCKVVFPVTKKAYEDPAVAATWLKAPRPPGMIASALDHSKSARLWYGEGHLPDLDGVYYGEIGQLWNNEAPATDVVASMQQLMEDVMAEPLDV